MSTILALITALVLIVVGMVRSRKTREPAAEVLIKRLVHPGHAWLRTTSDGYAVVGVDDFTQSVVGKIDAVSLPRLLARVKQGEAAWRLKHGERTLPMISPVSGWVVEKNDAVLRDPSLVNASPFGEGWLFKVKPYKLTAELRNLLTGREARRWQDAVRGHLQAFFSGTPALFMQDGGVLLQGLADRCSEEEWGRLASEFFLTPQKNGAQGA